MQLGGTLCTLVAVTASVFLMSVHERFHTHSQEGTIINFTLIVDKCKNVHFCRISLMRKLLISPYYGVTIHIRSKGKRPPGRPTRRWENNIKMDFREIGRGDMD
jgi:hypothetical protein